MPKVQTKSKPDLRCQKNAYVVDAQKRVWRVDRVDGEGTDCKIWLEDAHGEWLEKAKRYFHSEKWVTPHELAHTYTLGRAAPEVI